MQKVRNRGRRRERRLVPSLGVSDVHAHQHAHRLPLHGCGPKDATDQDDPTDYFGSINFIYRWLCPVGRIARTHETYTQRIEDDA